MLVHNNGLLKCWHGDSTAGRSRSLCRFVVSLGTVKTIVIGEHHGWWSWWSAAAVLNAQGANADGPIGHAAGAARAKCNRHHYKCIHDIHLALAVGAIVPHWKSNERRAAHRVHLRAVRSQCRLSAS